MIVVHTWNKLLSPGKTTRLLCTSIRNTYPVVFVVRGGREEEEKEGKKKRGSLVVSLSSSSSSSSSGLEGKEWKGGRKKKEEDNAGSRVGAVLNGNRLVSEVPGSWVTWRQGDTVAPPTVRWICRLAARLPQGRSFRVRVDPSGRRDADVHTAPPLDAPRRGKKSGYIPPPPGSLAASSCRFYAYGDDAATSLSPSPHSPATNVIALPR